MMRLHTYDSHSKIKCDFCDASLKDIEEEESAFTGAWRKHCPTCDRFTSYYIEPDPDAEFNARVDWEMDKRDD
jgi:hypothetical protein